MDVEHLISMDSLFAVQYVIGYLLGERVDGALGMTWGKKRHGGSIYNTQIVDAYNSSVGIYDGIRI